MSKAYQLSTDNGGSFLQPAILSAANTTLSNNSTAATVFISCKDSLDNLYVYCGSITEVNLDARILKITSSGVVSSFILAATSRVGSACYSVVPVVMCLSRDEKYLILSHYAGFGLENNSRLSFINIELFPSGNISPNSSMLVGGITTNAIKYAIYQDRYIWLSSGSTVKIYDYESKALLATSQAIDTAVAITCNSNNELYLSSPGVNQNLLKMVFNGTNAITTTTLSTTMPANIKQILIDRFGDIIILTNSGTASTLLKYTTAGALIQSLDLSVVSILGVGVAAYGLNVWHSDLGVQVSFQRDLGYWLTAPTTAQGQVFGAITKIRNTGNVTYSNDDGGDNNYSVIAD